MHHRKPHPPDHHPCLPPTPHTSTLLSSPPSASSGSAMQTQLQSASSMTSAPIGPNVHAKVFYFPCRCIMTRVLGLVKMATGVRGCPGGRELGAGVGSMFGMGWGVGLGLSLAASQNRDHNIHQNQIQNQNGNGNWSWVLEVPTCPTTSYLLYLHTHTIDSIPIPIQPRAIRKSHLALSLMICAFKKASWRSHALGPGH
jgi:hypothetical protein